MYHEKSNDMFLHQAKSLIRVVFTQYDKRISSTNSDARYVLIYPLTASEGSGQNGIMLGVNTIVLV